MKLENLCSVTETFVFCNWVTFVFGTPVLHHLDTCVLYWDTCKV